MAGLDIVTPGMKEVVGRQSSLDDLVAGLAPVDREALVYHSVRVLNSLAADRRTGLADDQEGFVQTLPPDLQAGYRDFVRRADTRVRLLHPAQQLVLVHAAARFGKATGGLTFAEPAARQAWAVACLQINDHLMNAPVPSAGQRGWENALCLFSEDASRWELMNPSRPDKSLARLRALFTTIPALGPAEAAAAGRLRVDFRTHLGLDFETAFNLTAFLVVHWVRASEKLADDPDAALINRRTWLENSTIPLGDFDRYMQAVAIRIPEIAAAFDALGVGMSFREVLPFRRRPLLRIGEDGVAFLAPQFMTEKGGVDLLWLLTNEPGGAREARMWTDDFGTLYERYVRSILEGLGARLGGQYVPDVHYGVAGHDEGQIDGLIRASSVLLVVEVKASQVRPTLLTHGTVDQVRDDLERKFVRNVGVRKGVSQLAHAISWLVQQRCEGRRVEGMDLKGVDTIIPVLVVADRYLRYPGLGQWLDYRLQDMVRVVAPRVQSLVLCGTEDLENLEHLALRAGPTVAESLIRYAWSVRGAAEPLWMHYEFPGGPHPRLGTVFDSWVTELLERRVLVR